MTIRHGCHAHGCELEVPPKLFMCRRHWYSLRKPLRDAIWREYRPGQERDKRPGPRYLAVQQLAIAELAFTPHDEEAAMTSANYVASAEKWRQAAIDAGLGDPLKGLIEVS